MICTLHKYYSSYRKKESQVGRTCGVGKRNEYKVLIGRRRHRGLNGMGGCGTDSSGSG